jgi:hypothetical protein
MLYITLGIIYVKSPGKSGRDTHQGWLSAIPNVVASWIYEGQVIQEKATRILSHLMLRV